MLLAGGKGRIPFTAVFFGHPRQIVDSANMQDGGDGALLLLCGGNALGNRLDSNAVGLADLQVTCRLLIVRANRDGVPGTIRSPFSHSLPPVFAGLHCRPCRRLLPPARPAAFVAALPFALASLGGRHLPLPC